MLKRIFLFVLIIIIITTTAACQTASKSDSDYSNQNSSNSNTPKNQTDGKSDESNVENDNNKQDTPSAEDLKEKTATIYFGDSQALGLVGEERTLQDITPEALINELIKGPQNSNHSRTIPEGTKLLGVEIKNKTAYVDFSRELKENHWGGSAGETFTIFSIVNTLVLQPNLDIEKVQILIEGKTVETLAGHADISTPLEPNLEMVDMK